MELHKSFVSYSEAGQGGGVISVSSNTDVTLANCEVSYNSSLQSSGGIQVMLGANAGIIQSLVSCNSATILGGGIAVFPFSSCSIKQSTISMNHVDSTATPDLGGGGVVVAGTSSSAVCNLINTIVFSNTSTLGDDDLRNLEFAQTTASYCCLGSVRGEFLSSSHLFGASPDFFDLENGDFHLLYGSSCINSGSPNYSQRGEDIDGEQRVFNGRIDIGADEFVNRDSDQIADVWELHYFGNLDRAGKEDDDFDSLDTLGEYRSKANPLINDTDGDLLNDGAEVAAGMQPNNPDEDKDLMLDGWEVKNALSPFTNEAALNLDGDCMTNLEEFRADTRPNDASSWLGLTDVSRQWGGTRLDWKGGRDSIQWIESSSNLIEWTNVMGIAPPTPEKNAIIVFDERSYYRIRVHRGSQAD